MKELNFVKKKKKKKKHFQLISEHVALIMKGSDPGKRVAQVNERAHSDRCEMGL